MITRQEYRAELLKALNRMPVTVLLGPRQCGKTTLAKSICAERGDATFLDLESPADRMRLQSPETALGSLSGLVVLDEVQTMPELFPVLRVLADRRDNPARFLLLGSAAPELMRRASDSLAGRVTFVDLAGFDIREVGKEQLATLWVRGGFPRSFLAETDAESNDWREDFVRTFLQRDVPQLGINIPAPALRRFWTMLAHSHGQVWNSSKIARSMGASDKTMRSYLDVLTGTYMLRQLQPWYANLNKRQVKSPKVYLRDSGLLHRLLTLRTEAELLSHPACGASWEGFAIEQVLRTANPDDCYFWATHAGAELDLMLMHGGKRYGVAFKFTNAPQRTQSMSIALSDLDLDHLWIVCRAPEAYPIDDRISVVPLAGFAAAWAERVG